MPSAATPPVESIVNAKAPLWQCLNSAGFKSDLAARASGIAAPQPASATKLTSAELHARAKLAAKKARHTAEEHSTGKWLEGVARPLGRIAPEHAAVFDAEDAALASMRSRRNAALWPWIVAASLRPCDLACVDPADTPPKFRELCGELFLRLSTLEPGHAGTEAAAQGASLTERVFKWFITALLGCLYPGIGAEATALAHEEWQLSGVTGFPILAAAAARKEPGPDGSSALSRPRRPKGSKSAAAQLADGTAVDPPSANFAHFTALVRVLLEPALHLPGTVAERSGVSTASMCAALESHVMPACLCEDAIRRLTAPEPSVVRRRISVASNGASVPRGDSGADVRKVLPTAASPTATASILPQIRRPAASLPPGATSDADAAGPPPIRGRRPSLAMADKARRKSSTPLPRLAPNSLMQA